MVVEIHSAHGLIPHRGIENLRAAMEQIIAKGEGVEVTGDVTHYHAPGLYGRRLAVPKDTILVSKVHKTTHITMILKGKFTFVDQNNIKTDVEAGDMWVTVPGTQRAIYCFEDSIIATVHAGDFSHKDDPIDDITADTMAEYLRWAHNRGQ